MFKTSTIKFLRELEKNNNRDWFEATSTATSPMYANRHWLTLKRWHPGWLKFPHILSPVRKRLGVR